MLNRIEQIAPKPNARPTTRRRKSVVISNTSELARTGYAFCIEGLEDRHPALQTGGGEHARGYHSVVPLITTKTSQQYSNVWLFIDSEITVLCPRTTDTQPQTDRSGLFRFALHAWHFHILLETSVIHQHIRAFTSQYDVRPGRKALMVGASLIQRRIK